jgi:2-aminoadipate transaminase
MKKTQITQTNSRPGFIDLGMGNPDQSLLPLQSLRISANAYFSSGDIRSLDYGLEQGDGNFRHALAFFLTKAYDRAAVDPGLLFVTAGASSGLDLICTLFTQPGDVILVEEPSYFLALRIFEDHGLQIISIPTDNDGLCLDILEDKIITAKPKFIYTIPTFHNPSGQTLSLDRREKLIVMAQRYNVFIVADEVYHFLDYHQTAPQPFAASAKNVEQVISINSFSKILAPGLRLGWILAHGRVINKLATCGLLDSGGGMNPFTSALIQGLIESGGLEENILKIKKEYNCRREAMGAALQEFLPQSEWVPPLGGFFYWVRLPGVDTTKLRHMAESFKVGIKQGVLFSSQKRMQDYIRLSFSFYDPIKISEGVKRLGKCLESRAKPSV